MTETHAPATWRALLGRDHLGAIGVLAGGVAIYATNVYLTTSLLPSAVTEIGGERFYAWATVVFLLASVASSVVVGNLLATVTHRAAYLVALGLFLAGTLACAVAPDMAVLLVGRAVQGLGGGLLAGLGYALIRSTLPASLWARASALVSAMWGVGTFVGPALGGLFAQLGIWRVAFVALAGSAVLIAIVVPRVLGSARSAATREPIPLAAVGLLTGAAAAVSVAGAVATPGVAVAGVAVGIGLVVAFVVRERRAALTVLPASTFRGGTPLPWIYATIAVLAVGSTAETFVPLFGQRLAGLAPLAAGFLGAALAAGWTLGELPSASASRTRTTRRIMTAGPLVLAAGLALAAVTQHADGPVLVWVIAYLLAGSGIGMAWPHLSSAAMSSVDDPGEGDKASAAINTVQLVANAVGASIAGLLVNLAGPDTATSALAMLGTLAVLAALGAVPARLIRTPE